MRHSRIFMVNLPSEKDSSNHSEVALDLSNQIIEYINQVSIKEGLQIHLSEISSLLNPGSDLHNFIIESVKNVIDEYISHTPDIPVIKISLLDKQGRILLRIKDEGRGFAQYPKGVHFFDSPEQTEKSDAHLGGFGLGLFLLTAKNNVSYKNSKRW